jgi:hypothetical protein
MNQHGFDEERAMPLTHNDLIDQLLVPAAFLFFLVAGIAGTALGAALIVFRGRVSGLFRPMNRWVSVRKSLGPLEKPHNIAPTVYKYRRGFSAAFIVGAAFSIVMLVTKVDVRAVVSRGADPHSFVGRWMWESLGWLLIELRTGDRDRHHSQFFPRVLGRSTRANHWYSPRRIGEAPMRCI